MRENIYAMEKKNNRNNREPRRQKEFDPSPRLHPDTKRSIWAIMFLGLALLFTLAAFGRAGPAGALLYVGCTALLGVGYFMLPLTLIFIAGIFFFSERQHVVGMAFVGGGLLLLGILATIEILSPGNGGWFGRILGSLRIPFGATAALVINIAISAIGLLAALNLPIKMRLPRRKATEEETTPAEEKEEETEKAALPRGEEETESLVAEPKRAPLAAIFKGKKAPPREFKNYVPPPLDLLKSSVEKPTTGDLRANANIIKRTLESFGISVEMGEVNIGPKVTRYTLKPAEGMKLSRITALAPDLALALAAHPIRIEAPIPGKSLVGIEVPNKAAAVVRLGSLMLYPEFSSTGPLGFVLGRDVTGEPILANIEKMPHLLIAGSTGSGKSVMIHSLILSLLYKNAPSNLRFVLIDPKRVELSVYEGIPHLASPVVIESKKAIGVFRWAIHEMDQRYEILQKAGSRDIKSYNAGAGKGDPLPYLVIVVDELADLMTSYGREVEGSIVRLAQMARATGLHLILSTQRPSVEVITGLIKANITSRIALQVASQIDSRTILDSSGAEKLLGGGDLLFVSSELSKPKRIQGAYVAEEEIRAVADFIRTHNETMEGALSFENGNGENGAGSGPDDFLEGDGDELYDEAVTVVREAQKASASLLQRRLKVGYARAARLLDLMEERGIIGPGEGAKPREVFVGKPGEDD